jgi:peroxiredoxin Q/BCP
MSNHPLTGQSAPVVSLPNADGTTYELKPGAEGKPTAVFFYPKAGAFPLSTA